MALTGFAIPHVNRGDSRPTSDSPLNLEGVRRSGWEITSRCSPKRLRQGLAQKQLALPRPKLLRVLQEREFERLGSTRTQRVDVRVVAATHRNLEEMIAEKQFRSDLYYRLNVFPITIPPLRERPGDIPALVRHFVQHAARRMNRAIDTIPCETMEALMQYPWPGNIRELENIIERGVILSPGPDPRPPYPYCTLAQSRAEPNSGRDRAKAYPGDPKGHEVGSLRPKGRSDAFGLEPCNSLFPHEEARNCPSLSVIPDATDHV
jgi:hypothetical protein